MRSLNTIHRFALAIMFALAALLAGRAAEPTREPLPPTAAVSNPATASGVNDRNPSASPEQVAPTEETAASPAVEIAIPDNSLLPLLTAEFALRERHYDYALSLLAEQALALHDIELTQRALKLAEFRERNDLALALAMHLASLDENDAAASATAMGLLIRAGRPLEAFGYARQAKARGIRINAPSLLVDFDRLSATQIASLSAGIEALAAEYPLDNDLAIALALVRKQNGDVTGSLAALDSLLDRESDEERGLVLWTQIKAERDDSNAFKRLIRALEQQPEAESLRLQYARILASQSKFAAAREQFELLLQQSPRNGDYLFSLALIEIEAQEPTAAIRNLQDLIALGQRLDEAHYYLGRIAEEQLQIDEAIRAYQQVGPSREFVDAKRRLGHLLLDDGDPSRVEAAFEEARAANPGQAEQLFMLQANLFEERDLIDRALATYDQALAIFTDSLALQYARAMTHEQRGDIAKAEQDLRAIIARDPNNATTLNALGYTLTVHTTRYQEAAELIEKANEITPGEAAILDSLGWVYFKLQRYNDAEAYLRQAYRLLPDPEVAAHLGETLWVMGRTEDALAIWRDALTRTPNNSHVTQTMGRLGVITPESTTQE